MRENIKGVTLIALVIAIMLLILLAGVSLYNGNETIQKAKLEGLKTNMLLIQAKAREYVEEVNFKIGMRIRGRKIRKKKGSKKRNICNK